MFKYSYFGCKLLTKTITIRDDVYKKLLSIKREDESFSELFERLVEDANPTETLKKLRGCVKFDEKEKMLSEIYARRAERRL
ncbi:MAG: antitoxin VapB family protein [Candidatus Freyarchaeota archaeon]|nr:antitoxin VapB family protein [Candidatus Jordarchaeia archaeon]MBS7270544.1 antitoxin VapB family protein [Candidatus Jordarchaeia archaeon]MBS7281320.1 antitoxin VapB family protein [Candidatus Jordarchaeia archaeon]